MKLKKLRFLVLTVIAVVALIFTSACSISPSEKGFSDNDGVSEFVNGVYEQNIISSNFLIEYHSYRISTLGAKINETKSMGSGVIFSVDNDIVGVGLYTYYLLTNNHVVYSNDAYSGFECVVTDCYGVSYEAVVEYSDAEYDLAVLSFQCREDYTVLDFALFDPKKGDMVMSLGSPQGVLNAVTVGEVKDYVEIELDDGGGDDSQLSNVTFEVIKHDAYVNNGSSGGVLIDEEYAICGINYAAEIDGDGNYVAGYAVPVSKVVEFITENER